MRIFDTNWMQIEEYLGGDDRVVLPVLPVLPFGLAPYWTAFPGSMTLRVTTCLAVVRDLLDSLPGEGFRRIAIVNGHGGEPVQVLFHSWYNAPKTALTASRFESAETIAGLIPGAELVVFEQSGHSPQIEERDRFQSVMRDFLVGVFPGGR